VITLKSSNTAFLLSEVAAIRIFPKHLAELPSFSQNPIGSGPYKFISRKSRDLIFERFDGYSSYRSKLQLEPRHFKKIIVRSIEDPTTRFLSLIGGDIDILINALSPGRLIEAKKINHLKITNSPGSAYQYLAFNLRIEKFKHQQLRKALALAINRDEIIQYKLKGYARAATNLLPPQNPFYNSSIAQIPYDPDLAKKTLAIAGAEGIEIELKTSTDRDTLSILEIIMKGWQNIGAKVTLRSAEFATFFSQIREGNFEAFSLRWTAVIDPDLLYKIFHSSERPPGRNRIHYSNSKFDSLVSQARAEDSYAKRHSLYQEAQKIISEDLPYIPLWYPDNVAVYSSNIENFELGPTHTWRGLLAAYKRDPK
jgi:peptide/nickel transport system substrate-binding protein